MIMIIITLNIITNNCDNINVLVRAVVDKCQMNATLAVSATGDFSTKQLINFGRKKTS